MVVELLTVVVAAVVPLVTVEMLQVLRLGLVVMEHQMFMLMDQVTLLCMLVVEEEDSVLAELQMVDLVVVDQVVSAL